MPTVVASDDGSMDGSGGDVGVDDERVTLTSRVASRNEEAGTIEDIEDENADGMSYNTCRRMVNDSLSG